MKNVLICPLDWGLGHATRCVPVINKFIEFGANVIIGADNRPLAFLKKEFPMLQFIRFPGYNVTYSEKGNMSLKMLRSAPRIFRRIKQEHKFLEKIISEYKIDVVVSDNRYGLWSKNVKTVFITHQLFIKCKGVLKLFESVLFFLNRHYINRYDECWIPDYEKLINLSGTLSKRHNSLKNIFFIGLLSRFKDIKIARNISPYKLLIIISGPEPQRTVFENLISEQIKKAALPKTLIVRGIPETTETQEISDNIHTVSHLGTKELAEAISSSDLVICRPGYSSIMDLVILEKNAVFVPTPGQTEQEYLANYYVSRNLFYSMKQSKFDIIKAIKKSTFYKGVKIGPDETNLINSRIKEVLE